MFTVGVFMDLFKAQSLSKTDATCLGWDSIADILKKHARLVNSFFLHFH